MCMTVSGCCRVGTVRSEWFSQHLAYVRRRICSRCIAEQCQGALKSNVHDGVWLLAPGRCAIRVVPLPWSHIGEAVGPADFFVNYGCRLILGADFLVNYVCRLLRGADFLVNYIRRLILGAPGQGLGLGFSFSLAGPSALTPGPCADWVG